ncbi:MAG TPA: DUF6289 family protein [Herpetosiphonaceae bacterium]
MSIRHLCSSSRRVLVLTSLILLLMLWTFVQVAQASAPPLGTERWEAYYSDATHTQLVGYRYWSCSGDLSIGGTFTQYYTISDSNCW